ncbi:hypothetical protein [Variovorax sp. 38R]|uniref:hypothetical protein n=1 Tax=Variovorax sp. 38R TaxID=2774875 RepID=UPI00177E4BBF|nr:hypothetical protein [Variovorax sp. 38R]QOF77548.1 hypothetical protein IG196_24875 [Variovorax sp. 38R]
MNHKMRMNWEGRWALTVNELAPGAFYFTVLDAITDNIDCLSYRPLITDETPHETPAEAWLAGVCALNALDVAKVDLPSL